MKKVQEPKLKEIFRFELKDPKLNVSWFYRRQSFFTNKNLFLAFFFSCLIFGFFQRMFWGMAIAMSLYFSFQYFQIRRLARSLKIKRLVDKHRYIEGAEFSYRYLLQNPSGFRLNDLVLKDYCGPSKEPEIKWSLKKSLEGGTYLQLPVKRVCDGGMGTHLLGPLQLELNDPFSVFRFVVEKEDTEEIQVLAFYGEAKSLKNSSQSLNYQMGAILRNRPGRSINFAGIREYYHGDPINHIAWKLSSKSEELLIKEFERSTNESYSILLNLNPYHHLGDKAFSSYEACKDICMAVIKNLLAERDLVQFISQAFQTDSSSHSSLFDSVAEYLSRQIAFDEKELQEAAFEEDQYGELEAPDANFLENTFARLSPEKKIIVISPLNVEAIEDLEKALKVRKNDFQDIIVLFLDLSPYQIQTSNHLPKRISQHIILHPNRINERSLLVPGLSCYLCREDRKGYGNSHWDFKEHYL
ncbi:MAG: DUF58 domain-containing protein [Bdellovibrionota bacterium]|nr:DUF58 domain-containing protein [Bdellovibrionota bacterium]